jgi:hypothetical protein
MNMQDFAQLHPAAQVALTVMAGLVLIVVVIEIGKLLRDK